MRTTHAYDVDFYIRPTEDGPGWDVVVNATELIVAWSREEFIAKQICILYTTSPELRRKYTTSQQEKIKQDVAKVQEVAEKHR